MSLELPDIPAELLQVHEDGKLVFFCGAGISRAAGLDDFGGLVTKINDRLGIGDPKEEEALNADPPAYDRFLHLVEARLRSPRMRQEVIKLLTPAARVALPEIHGHLLELATNREGRLRLVTTNFDGLFEAAAEARHLPLHVDSAPRLGLSAPERWNSLVHLHGRIDCERDGDGRDLVLTSGDFGRAYLTEAWASRFLRDLFQRYSVLFVGYSATDPVFRYVLDAFAAPRQYRLEEQEPRFYAFAAFDDDSTLPKVELDWKSKGIRPIMYRADKAHRFLIERLRGWAEVYRDGLRSRFYRMRRITESNAVGLSTETRSELSWLLSDPSGATARALWRKDGEGGVAIDRVCSADWLTTLEALELPRGEAVLSETMWRRIGKLEERLASPLVGQGGLPVVRLSPRLRAIAAWLAYLALDITIGPGETRSNSERLAQWALERGGWIHPEVCDEVLRRMPAVAMGEPELFRLWRVMTDPATNAALQLTPSNSIVDSIRLAKEIEAGLWDTRMKQTLLRLLEPVADLTHPKARRLADAVLTQAGPRAQRPERKLQDYLEVAVVPRVGDGLSYIEAALAQGPRSRELLADVASEATELLRRALSLHHYLVDGADWIETHTYDVVSGIGGKRSRRYGWTFFADLAASSAGAMHAVRPVHASGLLRLWRDSPFAVMRRLALHAGATWSGLPDDDRVAQLLNDDESSNLWGRWTRREAVHLISSLPKNLKRSAARRLATVLASGPPGGELGEDESNLRLRLAAACSAGFKLPAKLARRARALGADSVEADAAQAEAQAPAPHTVSYFAAPPKPARVDFDAMTLDQLVSHALRGFGWEDSIGRAFGEYESLLALSKPKRLLALIHALAAHRSSTAATNHVEGVVDAVPGRLAAYVRALVPADRCTDADWLAAWDVVIPIALAHARTETDVLDALSVALNEPTGTLVQALLERLLPPFVNRDMGLRPELTRRAELLLASDKPGARSAWAILAMRLFILSVADRTWATQYVLPLLEWRNETARDAWQGYLFDARVDDVLGPHIASRLVEACRHWEELEPVGRNLSELIVALSIDARGILGDHQARQALLHMGPQGRSHTAWILAKRLEDAGAQAGELWRDRIGTWLSRAWPADARARDEDTTDKLAWVATKAGDAFPEAVELLVGHGLLGRVRRHVLFQHELKENDCELARSYPDAALTLLVNVLPAREDIVAEQHRHWAFSGVSELLEATRPKLGDDARLDDLAERARLAGY